MSGSLSRRLTTRLVVPGLAAVLAAGLVYLRATPAAQNGAAEAITLSVVGTNDLHGALLSKDGRGGLDVFAGYVGNLRAARARDGGATVLVDAGDMFQGTLESNLPEGAPIVAAYGAMGYAAAAIGNHEFDFGPAGPSSTPVASTDDPWGALTARAAEATFPFLAANLIDVTTGRPVDWPNVLPSVLVEVAGVNVGVVGVMTAEALSATASANTRGLRVAPLAPAIAAEASKQRAAGAHVVIVVAHAGGRCTRFDRPADLSSCDADSAEIVSVVRRLPPASVDVVVVGHTHAGMAHLVEDTAVVVAF